MAVDSAGNAYVTGFSEGIGTSWDFVTIAYASVGVPLWTNYYNGRTRQGWSKGDRSATPAAASS